MSPPESSYHTTEDSEYSKIVQVQEKYLKTNYMKMTKFLKEEMIDLLKKSGKHKTIGGN